MHSPYSAMQLAGPYPLHEIAGGNGFVYPPTAAYPLVPLLLDGAPYVWERPECLRLAAVALAIVRREWGRLTTAGWLVAGAIILSQPGLYEVREGQMSPLIAASVDAMWLWPRQSGYLAVAGALFELYPVAGCSDGAQVGFRRPAARRRACHCPERRHCQLQSVRPMDHFAC